MKVSQFRKFKELTLPSQSPDLNPIEMVWDELDWRVKEKQPTIPQHFWELRQELK
jgi:transposase